jgi:[ribosomal protein S18]-alanine N-acetyltransferase
MAILIDPVSVEPMRKTDIQEVARIERRSYPTPWHENAYHTEIGNRSACYLVARIVGEIVGYGGMWVIMDEAHITTLAVAPEHRGKKIGERILQALIDEAYLMGATRASLEVRERNVVAQSLYRKYGFREAAIRKNYYSDNNENAVVMWVDEIHTYEYRERLRNQKAELYRAYDERLRHRDEL